MGLFSGIVSGLGGLLGANYSANNISHAGQDLANAITKGATLQSDAATGAGQTLSNAALGAGQTLSNAATLASQYGYNSAMFGGGVRNDAIQQAGDLYESGLGNKYENIKQGYQNSIDLTRGGYSDAIGTQRQTLADIQRLQNPYLQAGTSALAQLQAGLKEGGQYNRAFTREDAQNSDAYKFSLDEGTRAINAAAAAGGLQLSSANLQDLGKFAEGNAAQYQQQAFNQWLAQNNLSLGGLQRLVDTGQVSAGQVQQALSQAGSNISNLQVGQGRDLSSLTQGVFNAEGERAYATQAVRGDRIRNLAEAAAGAVDKGNTALAGGATNSAQALAAAQIQAANAAAAAQVASAGYQAGGITGAAQAQTAANLGAGSVKGSGLSGLFKDVAGGAFGNIGSLFGL